MDWLASLFLGMFLFGLLFCVATMLLGLGHVGFGHHGLHVDGAHGVGGHGIDVGHGGHAGHLPGIDGPDGAHGQVGGHGQAGHANGGHADSGVRATNTISPWNLTALTAFVAWFGGAGYLALTGWDLAAWASLLVAAVAGLAGWAAVYLFFNRVLLKGESRMDPADYRLEGTVARVSGPISAGRIGEIQYTKAGLRRSEGARSVDGSAIARDTEVVIVRYERGLAYVEPWQSFVGEAMPEEAGGKQ